MRSAKKPAIEPVSPQVIGALNSSAEVAFGLRAHARAAMPAHVIECADRAGCVAHHNEAFTGDLAEEIVAWVRDRIGSTGADPALAEELFHLLAMELGVSVVARRKSFEAVNRFL